MMKDFQKTGGIAALIAAATFVVGIAVGFTLLAPYLTDTLNPQQTVAFLADNQAIMYVWNMIIYVVFGVFLVVVALALHERLHKGARSTMQVATAFGLLWAGLVIASGMIFNVGSSLVVDLLGNNAEQAAAVWLAISAVQEGLGGGNEIVGGLWILLVSWAAMRTAGLPRVLIYLGAIIGVAGIVTVVPSLGDLGAIFGLGSILWFAWTGIVMVRG